MARKISEIKKIITDEFIANDAVIEMYGLQEGDTFDSKFSKVSIENILFYVFAFCAWTVEVLFDTHKKEVEDYIANMRPHTLRWYSTIAKSYQHGATLDGDTDKYNNSGFTEEQVETMQVVKYAAATENGGVLRIKLATGAERARQPLTQEQLDGFKYYISRVKDAGVIVEVINEPANEFDVTMDVYYNPMVLNSNLERIDGDSSGSVRSIIAQFVEELPFNGEYRNSDLIDKLLHADGVEFIEFSSASCDGQIINAFITPSSGYFKVGDLNNIRAIMYESV